MTVIAGYTDGENWAIAADSAVTEGEYWYLDGPKVWRRGEYLVGASGSYEQCTWVQDLATGEPYTVAAEMKARMGKKKGDFSVLIVSRGGVWVVDEQFIPIPHSHYWAVGSAAPPALGVLHYNWNYNSLEPMDVVIKAVEASTDLCVVARGPVVVLSAPVADRA